MPQLTRKMYTGAEMYRNERHERLSQQMEQIGQDFLKMLYSKGPSTDVSLDFEVSLRFIMNRLCSSAIFFYNRHEYNLLSS